MGFQILNKKILLQTRYLTIWETEFLNKNGEIQYWEWVEKKNAVIIFPITAQQNVVLIKNYRIPLEKYVIELPAGLRDKKNESVEETAKRELLEETGYEAKKLIPAHPKAFVCGSAKTLSCVFIAINLTKLNNNKGDENEDIIPLEIPFNRLVDFYFNLEKNSVFDLTILAVQNIAFHLGIRG